MKLSLLQQRTLYAVFVVVLWVGVLLADRLENTSLPAAGMALWALVYVSGFAALFAWLPKVGLPKWISLVLLLPIFGLLFITLTVFMPFKKQTNNNKTM